MKCPECGGNHFEENGVLKVLHAIDRWKLVHDYMAVMVEIGVSMQNDAVDNRKGAFLTRLRDCKECYFKGLWVGLLATSEQIVHDASGSRPWIMLAELERRVAETVFGERTTLSKNLISPGSTKFKAMDILNTSSHLTALFLLHRSQMSDSEARGMYEKVLKGVKMEAAHLKYVSEALRAGKDKKDIIDGIRNLRIKR